MVRLNNDSIPVLFLVGANGSGKTYKLKQGLEEETDSIILMIDEEGLPVFTRKKQNVKIDYANMTYIFEDERERGKAEQAHESEPINENVKKIIEFSKKTSDKLEQFLQRSKGQEKLFNLLGVFLNHSLNNVKYIYFDEPENYLDEEFIKILATFFELLNESGFVIRIATHNSRLLDIMKVNIENIIFFSDHESYSIAFEEIKTIFIESTAAVEAIRIRENINVEPSIKYKLEIYNLEETLDAFIMQTIKNENFYRCLFYKSIILVEGDSDIIALQSIKHKFESSSQVYSPNGKAYIPFFTKLFLHLKKELFVIIDDDKNDSEPRNQKHAVAITVFLEELRTSQEIQLVLHKPDLEAFYNIDVNEVGLRLGMSRSVRKGNGGWLKYLSAMTFFKEDTNKQVLIDHIFNDVDGDLSEYDLS